MSKYDEASGHSNQRISRASLIVTSFSRVTFGADPGPVGRSEAGAEDVESRPRTVKF